jgi:hypothetical protein
MYQTQGLMSDNRKRESYTISEETWEDYTCEGSWEFEGQVYKFISDELTDGDGEWHRVICRRESDAKFFEFAWGYNHGGGNYYHENYLNQVFPKTITKTTYE